MKSWNEYDDMADDEILIAIALRRGALLAGKRRGNRRVQLPANREGFNELDPHGIRSVLARKDRGEPWRIIGNRDFGGMHIPDYLNDLNAAWKLVEEMNAKERDLREWFSVPFDNPARSICRRYIKWKPIEPEQGDE